MPINEETITVEEVAVRGSFLNDPKRTPSITAECFKVASATGDVLAKTRTLTIAFNPTATFVVDGVTYTHQEFYRIFKALIVSEMEK